ncbi:kinase [Klebsiella pneumoniae]|nr:kinase [Klebsiella pneumoniae]
MTIRFYPSRLPGEPLETHEHGVTSIRKWLVTMLKVTRIGMFHR